MHSGSKAHRAGRYLTQPTGHRLLESLSDRPIVNVQAIEQLTGQKRNRRFCYQPYVELFVDSPTQVLA